MVDLIFVDDQLSVKTTKFTFLLGNLYKYNIIPLTTKVKQEKSFAIHWISCRENLRRSCFVCIESAEESHCS